MSDNLPLRPMLPALFSRAVSSKCG